MSRLLLRSVGILCQNSTSRPSTLIISKSLATVVSTSNCRNAQLAPLAAVVTKDTQRVIKENSMILAKVNDQRKLLISEPIVNNDKNGKDSIDADPLEKQNKASLDQLNLVADELIYHLPRFFSSPHPLSLYTNDVVFIDNIRSTRVQGISQYLIKISLVKLYFNLRYTSSKVEVLNLVKHLEESCIKIRWRVISRPGLMQFILFFYKFHTSEIWTDGISTMHVNKDGKIYCHVCDNIDVEKDNIEMKKAVKNPLINRGLNV